MWGAGGGRMQFNMKGKVTVQLRSRSPTLSNLYSSKQGLVRKISLLTGVISLCGQPSRPVDNKTKHNMTDVGAHKSRSVDR